jgi:acyl carrier protein
LEDVIGAVRSFLRDNFMLDDAEIGDEDSFMAGHVLDSTGFIELITFVEERFGVEVADDEMLPENFDSLRNIAGYVERKRGAAAA